MGFFNGELIEALLTGRYVCSECGSIMEFEDKWEDVLVCPECGHSVNLDHYGLEKGSDKDPPFFMRGIDTHALSFQ